MIFTVELIYLLVPTSNIIRISAGEFSGVTNLNSSEFLKNAT
jgi:hypothetical protein